MGILDPGDRYILVADDNYGVRKLFHEILSKEGYAVETVENGEEVIRKASDKTPSLLILDLIMPKLDGIDTFLKLKELNIEIPILFISTYSDRERFNTAIDLGYIQYHLKKPFDIEDLKEIINKILLTDFRLTTKSC